MITDSVDVIRISRPETPALDLIRRLESSMPPLRIVPRNDVIAARRGLLINSQTEHFPYDVEIGGLSVEIQKGVFSPKWFESTYLFCEMLPYQRGLRLLDMGCGCGVLAIMAALKGAVVADAVDILPEAIENTRQNVLRHSVHNAVRVWQTDLFKDVEPNHQYDVIFWNSPWVYINEGYQPSSLEISVFDPGYSMLSNFLEGAPDRLAPGGRVLLGFGNFGEVSALKELAKERYSLTELDRRVGKEPDRLEYMIYDLRPGSNM